MIPPDSMGSYVSIPEFQKAMRPGKTVTTMIPNNWIPSPNTVIWRYMSFAKFELLMNDRSLFFARVDKLEDDFEGSWSKATLELVNRTARYSIYDAGWYIVLRNEDTGQQLNLNLVQKSITPDVQHILDGMHSTPDDWGYFKNPFGTLYMYHKPTGYRFGLRDAMVNHQLGSIDLSLRVTREIMQLASYQTKFILVNCWHINAYESDVMWSRYSDRKDSVAIKTNVESLIRCFMDKYPSAVGHVQYADFDTDVMPALYFELPYWFKRIQFEADHELRVIMDETVYSNITDYSRTPDYSREVCDVGLPYQIDPKVLIHEIVVGPGTNVQVFDSIRSIARGYGVEVPVTQSSLKK